MMTPLRSVIQIVTSLRENCEPSQLQPLTVVFNTVSLLLSQVQQNMDYSILKHGELNPNL